MRRYRHYDDTEAIKKSRDFYSNEETDIDISITDTKSIDDDYELGYEIGRRKALKELNQLNEQQELHMKDDILEGFVYEELFDQIKSNNGNLKDFTEEDVKNIIKKEFEDLIEIKVSEAKDIVDKYINQIYKDCTTEDK